MSYTKLNPRNGQTQVNDVTMKHLDDGIYNIDQNKIDKSTIELLTVDSVAPENCSEGDLYYNTTTNLIYIATATDTWSETGELPTSKYLYVDLSNSKLYYYDGTTFTSYGGGSSVDVDTEMSDSSTNAVQNKVIKEYVDNQVIISDTEPTDSDNKIWIDTGEIAQAHTEITNEYSTSTGIGYSANYINNLFTYSTTEQRVGTWINGKPLYRKVFTDSSTTSGDHEISISSINHDYISLVDWNMISRDFCLKNFGADGGTTYANSFINSLDKKIIWVTGTWWADCSYVAIVEYTKTTD